MLRYIRKNSVKCSNLQRHMVGNGYEVFSSVRGTPQSNMAATLTHNFVTNSR
jgi:hypothetical protein